MNTHLTYFLALPGQIGLNKQVSSLRRTFGDKVRAMIYTASTRDSGASFNKADNVLGYAQVKS